MGRAFARFLATVVLVSSAAGSLRATGPANFMLSTSVDGQLIEGQPLTWTDHQMLLYGRDGMLYEFHPKKAKKSKKIGTGFRSYSIEEMRTRLSEEWSGWLEVTTTAHFVVAHPRGQWQAWAHRLESLYRSFTRYMQVRGFPIKAPRVPLVAIVFRNQSEYYRFAEQSGKPLQPGTLGHYDSLTNRIFLFDSSDPHGNDDWSLNAETIIHEATHQSAYNTGVHRRFAEQPRWLVEGLAMMFEAKGVWDRRSVYDRSDRINRGRLRDFRAYQHVRSTRAIAELVASDQEFERRAIQAYAEAWTLNFFLCETRPQEYSRYLSRVASRTAFSTYSARERVEDFTAEFGSDFDLLESQLQRFVEELQ